MEAVDGELVADLLQHPALGLGDAAVGGGHVAGQRIGGFPEPFGEEAAHEGEELVEQPFQRLIERRKLFSYRYPGFWKSMDTHKDTVYLSTLCAEGPGPWLGAPGSA